MCQYPSPHQRVCAEPDSWAPQARRVQQQLALAPQPLARVQVPQRQQHLRRQLAEIELWRLLRLVALTKTLIFGPAGPRMQTGSGMRSGILHAHRPVAAFVLPPASVRLDSRTQTRPLRIDYTSIHANEICDSTAFLLFEARLPMRRTCCMPVRPSMSRRSSIKPKHGSPALVSCWLPCWASSLHWCASSEHAGTRNWGAEGVGAFACCVNGIRTTTIMSMQARKQKHAHAAWLGSGSHSWYSLSLRLMPLPSWAPTPRTPAHEWRAPRGLRAPSTSCPSRRCRLPAW